MKLTVQHLHNATTFSCQLQPPGGTIGRGEQNDLNLPDTSGELSSLQAIIRMDHGRKGGTVLNMSSMGRVAVNDTPLGLSQEATVNDGDRIAVGDYLITVEKPSATVKPAGIDDASLSATPYDTVAFTSVTAAAAAFGGTSEAVARESGLDTDDKPETLPTWHPAYQAPAQPASDSREHPSEHPLGAPEARIASVDAAVPAAQADPYPEEHPLGTPINRMPPPPPTPNTTVAPMPGNATTSYAPQESTEVTDAGKIAPFAPVPVPEDNPDDIFKDLLSGPGVLPVGGVTTDERHPFDMESATNRNHHNPVELLRPEGLHHPSIDGDPLDTLPTDGTDKDRYTIFSDDSPTTLNKDTALDSHKQDNILETLRRAAHSGYKEENQGKKGDK